MLGSFLITLREGLEAALVIGIILAYLSRTGNRGGFRPVWVGTALAIAVSLITGGAIYLFAGALEEPGEAIFEGITMLIAAGVITWMIFWMRRQAVNIRANLHSQIETALGRNPTLGLALIAFIAVAREGIETVVFLFAATQSENSPLMSFLGGITGLAVAVVIGYTIYIGTSRLNLKVFFNITGLLLMFFAAGLIAHGVHELNEVGFIPPLIEHLWDMNNVIAEQSTPGRFLTALFGYNANPSLTEILAYWIFLVTVLGSFFRSLRNERKVQGGTGKASRMLGSPSTPAAHRE
ncbi:MAG: hypothetical protein A2Z29_00110 [Chloroflexi bacterium RBG_16_56_11]|nr:MAG: hypothetical protein A2Z29_00110 [Chloroflexi bacterium RBG_16_56_11]